MGTDLMRQLYNKDLPSFKKILSEGKIKERELKTVYEILATSERDEITFAIYSSLKKYPNLLDYKLLSNITSLRENILQELFSTAPKKALFPIVDSNSQQKELATAYIFKLSQKPNRLSFTTKRQNELQRIEKFLQNISPTEHFFVLFDKEFDGNSYLLAVAAGILLPNDALKKYAFTGEVNERGEIFEVKSLEEKRQVCKQAGLELMSAGDFSSLPKMRYYLDDSVDKDIPFLFLNQSIGETEESLSRLETEIQKKVPFYSLKKIFSLYRLSREELFIQNEKIPNNSDAWNQYLKLFAQKIKKINDELKNYTLHIGTSISAMSFGMGIILGAKRKYILYHFQGGNYYPLIDLKSDSRSIKNVAKREPKQIKISAEIHDNPHTVDLIIYLASHSLQRSVREFTKNPNQIFIKVGDNKQGKLPLEPDVWSEIVSELYSTINEYRDRYGIKKFNLFLSCPAIIALALGMAVGNFIDIDVYHYIPERREYFLAFNATNLQTAL